MVGDQDADAAFTQSSTILMISQTAIGSMPARHIL